MDREAALDKCLETVKKNMLDRTHSRDANGSFMNVEEDFHDEAFWAGGSRFEYETDKKGEKNNG